MHCPSFFSFHFLSFSISFYKLTIFTIYVSTWLPRCRKSLHSLERYKIKEWYKNSIPPLFLCIIRYIIGLESMKLQSQKKKKFASIPERRTQKQAFTIWHFQKCACVNGIYFAPVATTTYRMKNNKSSARGLSLKMRALARARAQLN